MNPEIKHILEPQEKILWHGKPDIKSLLFFAILCSTFVLFIAAILFFNLDSDTLKCTINGIKKTGTACSKTFYIICTVLVFVAFTIPLVMYLYYKVTHYVITNKRILINSGFIGADIRSIYYDQIKSAFVNVGLIGKLFGTGTILIDTGRITQSRRRGSKTTYDRFRFIIQPYSVYKFVQQGLSNRKEGMHSGRADFESNKEAFKEFIQETEKMKNSNT
ncbi:MAG: PH domain-containing protein [Oceanihabitans sp.]